MLRITIPKQEVYNEVTQEFGETKEQTLTLQHSLVSVSKWESQYKKPFLNKERKTAKETVDYIKYMTITQNVDPSVYNFITNQNIAEVNAYIEDSMTATTFSKDPKGKINREIITSEIIYYWMVALNIPFECEKWHLNRLLTLINVCNIKARPATKMSKKDIYSRNRALNAARRKSLNTAG